ncbi:MAG: hypothetical protein QOE77_1644 [Blastocatellia bacterium]|jgi:hypothetical protein|nr:hypothetical protein [Blastocatellia bacterium]
MKTESIIKIKGYLAARLKVPLIWSAVASEARHRFGWQFVLLKFDPKRRRRSALPAHSNLGHDPTIAVLDSVNQIMIQGRLAAGTRI